MKLITHFNNFLKDTINLNQSRITELETKVTSIDNFLKGNSLFGEYYIKTDPQGSWAHKTIIKPSPKSPEFDADVLFYMKEVEGWNAKDYVENLYKEFKKSGTYKDKVRRNTRCVVIDYKGEFHIDIIPIFEKDEGFIIEELHTYITNRISNDYEETNPEGYLDWFNKKKRQTKSKLIKVIRLAKYLRDIKKNFSVKSILLTTLLGERVKTGWWESDTADEVYPDVPTALKELFNRLNDFLQDNEEMPVIYNPSLESEDFVRHWDETKYKNFRNKIALYTRKINDAYDETDRDESIKKWRLVFGDEFAKGVTLSEPTQKSWRNTEEFIENKYLVDIQYSLTIDCLVTQAGYQPHWLRKLLAKKTPLKPKKKLKFSIKNNAVPYPYSVEWKVLNRGRIAQQRDCIRGQIVADKGKEQKTEDTSFNGEHQVECYIIKDSAVVAKDTITVPIKEV